MTEEVQIDVVEQPSEAKPSAGRVLAEARKRSGLSVADVASQLRLSTRQIEALEADDFVRLPGKTYLRGFIHNYAKLLQIDPEPLLSGCQEAQPKDRSIVVPTSRIEFGGKRRFLPFSDHPRKPWPKYSLAIVVAVLCLSWGTYELIQWQQKPSQSETARADSDATMTLSLPQPQAETAVPSASPGANAAADPAPPPAPAALAVAPSPAPAQVSAADATAEVGGKRLDFVFDGDAWVEVKDKGGKVIFYQLNPKGSQQSVRGAAPFSLVVGNSSRVKLSYNGKPVDLAPHTKVDVARLTLE